MNRICYQCEKPFVFNADSYSRLHCSKACADAWDAEIDADRIANGRKPIWSKSIAAPEITENTESNSPTSEN